MLRYSIPSYRTSYVYNRRQKYSRRAEEIQQPIDGRDKNDKGLATEYRRAIL